MKILLTVLLLLLNASISFGVDFTKLSRTEPVTTVYPSNFKCYVDVSLFLNATEAYSGQLFLRVSYVIGSDTLNDNLSISGSHNAVIKQLFLDEGERLTAFVHLNNGEIEELENIEGSLRIVRNPDFQPTEEQGKNTFLSGVWKSDQTPLFRVGIKDSIPQVFRLKLFFNRNYEYDRLYFKMKIISPATGIVMLTKEVIVNEEGTLESRNKIFTVDVGEIDLSTIGTYYFQIMPNMQAERINGIEKIEYDIVRQ